MMSQITLDGLLLDVEWSACPLVEIEGVFIQQPGPDGKLVDVSIIDNVTDTFMARITEKVYQELDNMKYRRAI